MAIIVLHRPTKTRYVMLGSGFAGGVPPRPSVAVGGFGRTAFIPITGTSGLVAVCARNGEIGWVPSDELTVLEIDGRPPQQLLNPSGPYR